jgi:hypothetical protein
MFLPSRCLATIYGDTDTQTDGSLKYAVELGSVAMIYIPSSSHSRVDKGGHTDSMVIAYAYFHFSKEGK